MGTRKDIDTIPPRQCTAMSKQNKRRCKNWAIPGYTVCKFHGAYGGKGVDGIVNGMYSNKVNISLKERYEEFLEHTDALEGINEDIALMRAMMSDVLSETPTNSEEKQIQMNVFLRYMRDIREATGLKNSIESKFSVSIQTVQIFLNQVLYVLNKNIDDEDTLNRIVGQLRNIKLLDENHPQLVHGRKG